MIGVACAAVRWLNKLKKKEIPRDPGLCGPNFVVVVVVVVVVVLLVASRHLKKKKSLFGMPFGFDPRESLCR